VLSKVQVSAGVDAVQHTLNMVSAVDGVARLNGLENVVGAREVGTITRIASNLAKVLSGDRDTQLLLRKMAAEYGIAREEHTYTGIFGHKSLGGAWVRLVDQAGRLTLFKTAQELANAGLISKDPVEIRNFVNKNLGLYNSRLLPVWQALAKSTLSPFLVAGKTFNRLGASRLLLSPGVKAANPTAWATMRARQALYLGTALIVVPAVLNQAWSGTPFPPDTKFGEIKLPNGKIIDMARYTLARRGMRITGVQAVLSGIENNQTPRQIGTQAFTDVARGVAAPYAGPLPNIVGSLLTGKSALGYRTAQPNERYPYFAAAARQANPLLGAGLTDQPRTGLENRFGSMVGIRSSAPINQVYQLAASYKDRNKIGWNPEQFDPSQYGDLKKALLAGDVATAKQAYDALLKQKEQRTDVTPEQAEYAAKLTIQKEFERAEKFYFVNKGDEAKFQGQLTPRQRELYNTAQQQLKSMADLFFDQVQHKIEHKKPKAAHFGW
jgi:hypothetical protein